MAALVLEMRLAENRFAVKQLCGEMSLRFRAASISFSSLRLAIHSQWFVGESRYYVNILQTWRQKLYKLCEEL